MSRDDARIVVVHESLPAVSRVAAVAATLIRLVPIMVLVQAEAMEAEATEVAAEAAEVMVVPEVVAEAAEAMVVVETAPDDRCIRLPVRIAANQLKCRSNRVAISLSTVRIALNQSAVLASN